MSRLKQIIVLLLCLVSVAAWGQRRYSADGRRERDLSRVRGFSSRDVDSKTDAFLGLHASLYKGARQYIGFSVDGGWSTMLDNSPVTSATPGGWAANAKLLYEYHFGLLFLQTGLGVGIQRVTTPVDIAKIDDLLNDGLLDGVGDASWRTFFNGYSGEEQGRQYPMTDYDGVHYNMVHQFGNRTDMSEKYYAQLPVNLGYYIVGSYGIGYVMLGAQLNYAFAGKTVMKGTGTSYGLFDVDEGDRYIGPIEEVPTHGFRKDVPITYKGASVPTKLGTVVGLDVLGHIEGGYEYNTFQKIRQYRVKRADKLDCRMRFSAFMDISLGNIYPYGASPMFESKVETGGQGQDNLANFHHPEITPFVMNHIYSSSIPYQVNNVLPSGKAPWLRNMTVGVRFTVLFSLQAQEHCILCDPWRH